METQTMSSDVAEQYEYVHRYIDDEDIAADAEQQGYDLYNNDELADAIRASFWKTIDGSIMSHVESGSDRVSALARVLPEVPESMTDEVIQAERDAIAQLGDWRTLTQQLRLEQIAEEYGQNTYEDRLTLWDELLKFTDYAVSFFAETADGEQNYQGTLRRQSSTTAHNDALRRATRGYDEYEMDEMSVQVADRPFPDTDPLPDVEEFVFRD